MYGFNFSRLTWYHRVSQNRSRSASYLLVRPVSRALLHEEKPDRPFRRNGEAASLRGGQILGSGRIRIRPVRFPERSEDLERVLPGERAAENQDAGPVSDSRVEGCP